MPKRKRNKKIEFFVSEAEHRLILERAKKFGTSNLSAYLRKTAIDVTIFNINTDGLFELSTQISHIGNNINQIARKCNKTGSLTQDELKNLKYMQEQIYGILKKDYDKVSYIINHKRP